MRHQIIQRAINQRVLIIEKILNTINPATKYVVFRVSSLPLIKARLAGNGCSLVKSRNTEQG
ncbi:MAG: hypothetical protein ABW109_21755, partial [Candidatus Thiodiazotropha sp. 6PLUC4]